MAAARVKALAVEQIALRLHEHLGLLSGGSRAALPRQQTLRATLDWSYGLLGASERLLLGRLSVCAGGWVLEAAERVCAGDGIEPYEVLDLLTGLVDKSLAVFEEWEGGGRYRLMETVRQYAAERLRASAEAEQVWARHRDWCVALAEEAEPQLKGAGQAAWLRRLEAEYDNLRAVLAGGGAGAQGAEAGLRLTGALWWFWKVRGHFSEGRRYLGQALERAGAQAGTEARAKALNGAGALALNQGDYAATRALHEESLDLFRKQGNRRGVASALNNLANLASHLGDHATAFSLYQESLGVYRESGDKQGIAMSLSNLGMEVRQQGDYAWARALYEESLEIRRGLGDELGVGLALASLGNVIRLQGDYVTARALLEESLEIRRALKDTQGVAWTLSHLGSLATAQGDSTSARALFEESLGIRRKLGEKRGVAWSLNNLGGISLIEGRFVAARALLEESLNIFRELGDRGGAASVLNQLGGMKSLQGDYAAAQALLEDGLRIFSELGDTEGVAANLRALAAVRLEMAAAEPAVHLWGAAEALRESIGAPLPPNEQEEYEHQVGQARAVLGGDAFGRLGAGPRPDLGAGGDLCSGRGTRRAQRAFLTDPRQQPQCRGWRVVANTAYPRFQANKKIPLAANGGRSQLLPPSSPSSFMLHYEGYQTSPLEAYRRQSEEFANSINRCRTP